MNLVFILDSFGMGGSEKTALILMKLLKDYKEINMSLVILAKSDSRISRKSYNVPEGIDTYYVYQDNYSSMKKLFLTPVTLYKIKSLLESKNITKIVSFHDYANLINVLLKKSLNHQAITSERKYSKNYFGSKNKYMKHFLEFVFNKSDIVIVNDNDIRESLKNDYGVETRIEVLNNLINAEVFSEDKIKDFGNKKQIVFITVGRLSDEKNTKDILYAFAKIKQENFILQIIGNGPNRDFLEKLSIELSIDNQVEFIGQVNDVYKYLNKADIFVFSSLTEGFPNVVLEAMYAGLPIISYKFKAGITSILDNGKYGILVDIHHIDALSSQMLTLATNVRIRQEYSKLSKQRSEKYTNKTKYVNDFIKILDKQELD